MTIRLMSLTAALGLLVAGCSEPAAAPVQKVVEVTGKITVGGKPGERLSLTFIPAADGAGIEAVAGSQPGGTYTVRLVAAKYKVVFESAGGPTIPKAYRDKATTTAEIDATGASMTKDFELK